MWIRPSFQEPGGDPRVSRLAHPASAPVRVLAPSALGGTREFSAESPSCAVPRVYCDQAGGTLLWPARLVLCRSTQSSRQAEGTAAGLGHVVGAFEACRSAERSC